MGLRRQDWKHVLLTLAAATAVLASSAAADPLIIGNYPPTNDSSQRNIDDGFGLAVGFTMPAGAGIPLPPVQVRLSVQTAVTSFEADLFGDSGGVPTGPILVSFTDPLSFPISGTVCVDYVLTPASAFTLLPSTTYWLRLRGNAPAGAGDLNWCSSNPEKAYTGIATSAGEFQNFSDPPTSNFGSTPPNNPTYQLGGEFEGISVVEIPVLGPKGLIVMAVLLGLVAAFALRRRSKSSPVSAPRAN